MFLGFLLRQAIAFSYIVADPSADLYAFDPDVRKVLEVVLSEGRTLILVGFGQSRWEKPCQSRLGLVHGAVAGHPSNELNRIL
jgi:hypothetical protein